MDWEKVYERLRQAKLNGRVVNSEESMETIKKLSEWHRKLFIEYFDFALDVSTEGISLSSFKSFRYPILEFLAQEKINRKLLTEITQDDIDDFLLNKGQRVKLITLYNNQNENI